MVLLFFGRKIIIGQIQKLGPIQSYRDFLLCQDIIYRTR